MKKYLVIVLAVVALVTLSACQLAPQGSQDVGKLFDKQYNGAVVTVTVGSGDDALQSTFNVTYQSTQTQVNYTFQQFATIGQDGAMPSQMIQTFTGSAVIEDGVVTTLNGEQSPFALQNIAQVRWNFDANNVTNVEQTVTSYKATVKNVAGFLGNSQVVATNMTVSIYYVANYFTNAQLNYVDANGKAVSVVYKLSF